MRINRAIAASGACSRRKADQLIEEGRVTVNGVRLDNPGAQVEPTDVIAVDGRRIFAQKLRYYAYNKPIRTLASHGDPHHERVIYDDLPEGEGLFSVGRLDFMSEGLMLITNDGELAQQLAHPRYAHEKCYLVLVDAMIAQEACRRLCSGIMKTGVSYRARAVDPVSASAYPALMQAVTEPEPFFDRQHMLYRVVLAEGKKREIRQLFSAIGHPVIRLVRWSQAGITLDGLAPGAYRELDPKEIRR